MEFEITNDEEAESMINDIRADLAHIDRATPKDRLATLRDISRSITELIDHYK